ncbi:hypothetical protein DPEC_G00050390 [Dallia pectoralis]|uniref:Uncharacterized protein n=1 Tax=Dallia pectoralis TaxID=75939 RepID=A0ACC2HB24_DALPE|nr:hypothetical protein DPEC_G00050390 [Dallia pectoralis]
MTHEEDHGRPGGEAALGGSRLGRDTLGKATLGGARSSGAAEAVQTDTYSVYNTIQTGGDAERGVKRSIIWPPKLLSPDSTAGPCLKGKKGREDMTKTVSAPLRPCPILPSLLHLSFLESSSDPLPRHRIAAVVINKTKGSHGIHSTGGSGATDSAGHQSAPHIATQPLQAVAWLHSSLCQINPEFSKFLLQPVIARIPTTSAPCGPALSTTGCSDQCQRGISEWCAMQS